MKVQFFLSKHLDKSTLEYILLLNNVHESVYQVNTDEKRPETNPDLLNFNYDLNLLPGKFLVAFLPFEVLSRFTKEAVLHFRIQ